MTNALPDFPALAYRVFSQQNSLFLQKGTVPYLQKMFEDLAVPRDEIPTSLQWFVDRLKSQEGITY